MLALNMPSSSPRSPVFEPLAYSSFALSQEKPVCWKCPHSYFFWARFQHSYRNGEILLKLFFPLPVLLGGWIDSCNAGFYFLAYKQIMWHRAIFSLGGPWIIKNMGATLFFSPWCVTPHVSAFVLFVLSWQVRLMSSWNMHVDIHSPVRLYTQPPTGMLEMKSMAHWAQSSEAQGSVWHLSLPFYSWRSHSPLTSPWPLIWAVRSWLQGTGNCTAHFVRVLVPFCQSRQAFLFECMISPTHQKIMPYHIRSNQYGPRKKRYFSASINFACVC